MRHRVIHLLLAAATALVASPVFAAQSDSAPPAATPGQANADAVGTIIVVTATKRRENIQSIPIAVAALSGVDLTNKGIASSADLVRVVPGLTYAKSGTNTPIFSLRGVGQSHCGCGVAFGVGDNFPVCQSQK